MVTHLNSWQAWLCLTLVNWQEAILSDLVNLYIPWWDVSSLTEQKSGWVSIWEIYSSISMLYAKTLSVKISYPPRVTVSCNWSFNKEQSYDTKCRTGNRMVRSFARKKRKAKCLKNFFKHSYLAFCAFIWSETRYVLEPENAWIECKR